VRGSQPVGQVCDLAFRLTEAAYSTSILPHQPHQAAVRAKAQLVDIPGSYLLQVISRTSTDQRLLVGLNIPQEQQVAILLDVPKPGIKTVQL